MNMIIQKSLVESILSQLWRFFASLRMTGEGLRLKGEGFTFFAPERNPVNLVHLSKIERRIWLSCQ